MTNSHLIEFILFYIIHSILAEGYFMGITERREREKEQRRNDIIDAAENVFFSKGFDNASMDDVAAEAELSKGTLYLYFKNKEDLYLALHSRGHNIMQAMFEKAVAQYNSGIKKVRAIGEAYYQFYKKYPKYFHVLIYFESRDIDFSDENSAAMICMREGMKILEILVEAIKAGIKDQSIRPDVDPLKTALSLWGESTGIFQILALKKDILKHIMSLDEQEIINYAFDLITYSLSNK
jgi:TetR/AcrR family transcriptional regulator